MDDQIADRLKELKVVMTGQLFQSVNKIERQNLSIDGNTHIIAKEISDFKKEFENFNENFKSEWAELIRIVYEAQEENREIIKDQEIAFQEGRDRLQKTTEQLITKINLNVAEQNSQWAQQETKISEVMKMKSEILDSIKEQIYEAKEQKNETELLRSDADAWVDHLDKKLEKCRYNAMKENGQIRNRIEDLEKSLTNKARIEQERLEEGYFNITSFLKHQAEIEKYMRYFVVFASIVAIILLTMIHWGN